VDGDGRTGFGAAIDAREPGRVVGPDDGREDDRPALEGRPGELEAEGPRLPEVRLTEFRVPPLAPPPPDLPFP
jgi:hypothetical protein